MCAIFRKRKGKHLKRIISPELIFILNLIINGKVCGTSRTKFIKDNDSVRTMRQIKNYQGDNDYFENSLFEGMEDIFMFLKRYLILK